MGYLTLSRHTDALLIKSDHPLEGYSGSTTFRLWRSNASKGCLQCSNQDEYLSVQVKRVESGFLIDMTPIVPTLTFGYYTGQMKIGCDLSNEMKFYFLEYLKMSASEVKGTTTRKECCDDHHGVCRGIDLEYEVVSSAGNMLTLRLKDSVTSQAKQNSGRSGDIVFELDGSCHHR